MLIVLAALYAKTSVSCNHCKLRHQRTKQKKHWEVTVFNEVLTFVLPDQQIRECTIIVSVYEIQPSKKSSKRLIGHIHIKKGNTLENEHWKLMMESLRQPIAKWHLIFIWIHISFQFQMGAVSTYFRPLCRFQVGMRKCVLLKNKMLHFVPHWV